MNGKLRVAGIGLALSVMGGLVLLVVRPSLDPAQIRPLPLIAGACGDGLGDLRGSSNPRNFVASTAPFTPPVAGIR